MISGDPSSPPLLSDQEKHMGTKAKPIIAILVGAPGSGKSTFCNDVINAGRRPWVRVCQDIISNGKAGTKAQCLKLATDSLNGGKSVFIDRCNLDREQRLEFVKLGGAKEADVHAVVLDLPARVCISRSVKRTEHEGNLQGGKSAAVVNRMLQKKELPKLNEGFSRIMFCQNEADVKDALYAYSVLGPNDSLPSGSFGQRSSDAKVQLGIMKFMKKVEKPETLECNKSNMVSDQNVSLDCVSKQESKGKDQSPMDVDRKNNDKFDMEDKILLDKDNSDSFLRKDVLTLAFPSISTSDFQFNLEKASDIIVETVADFLNKVDNVRLVLVDLSHKSRILSLVNAKALRKNIDPKKFFTFVGDITRLSTEGKLQCNVIANAANWRLKPGGGGVNASIFSAAGEALEFATKERAESLTPGSAVDVPLPSTSTLYKREGVTHVIHVLGPNMNPQRSNCLKNDYVKGCNVLRNAYSSLFQKFASISQSQIYLKNGDMNSMLGFSDSNNSPLKGSSDNFSPQNDQKNKREHCFESEGNKKPKGLPSDDGNNRAEDTLGPVHPEVGSVAEKSDAGRGHSSAVTDSHIEKTQTKKIAEGSKNTWASWAQSLHQIAKDPEKHNDVVLEISDDYVVINDRYPKAKKHILVLSRLQGLDSLADVQREHLPLMRNLHSTGLKWAHKFFEEDDALMFRLGYHSVPSMRQLHLHVISQDFDSPHLKNKKHWNSFTSSFFLDSSGVIEEIDKHGSAIVDQDEKCLSMELRCHRCKSAHPSIPKLKIHISRCKASFPLPLLQNGSLLSPSKAVSGA